MEEEGKVVDTEDYSYFHGLKAQLQSQQEAGDTDMARSTAARIENMQQNYAWHVTQARTDLATIHRAFGEDQTNATGKTKRTRRQAPYAHEIVRIHEPRKSSPNHGGPFQPAMARHGEVVSAQGNESP